MYYLFPRNVKSYDDAIIIFYFRILFTIYLRSRRVKLLFAIIYDLLASFAIRLAIYDCNDLFTRIKLLCYSVIINDLLASFAIRLFIYDLLATFAIY